MNIQEFKSHVEGSLELIGLRAKHLLFEGRKKLPVRPPLLWAKTLESYFDLYSRDLQGETIASIQDATIFECCGYVAMMHMQKLTVEQFIKVLWSKNQRYGHRSLIRWGAFGIIVRMDSKVQRLINMLQSPELTVDFEETELDESIEDTWIDILGYSVLGLMVQRGAFR